MKLPAAGGMTKQPSQMGLAGFAAGNLPAMALEPGKLGRWCAEIEASWRKPETSDLEDDSGRIGKGVPVMAPHLDSLGYAGYLGQAESAANPFAWPGFLLARTVPNARRPTGQGAAFAFIEILEPVNAVRDGENELHRCIRADWAALF